MKGLRTIALVAGMLAASATAVHYTPRPMVAAGEKPSVSLEVLIPDHFGDWQIDRSAPGTVVNPVLTGELAKYYTETLSRVYVNGQGDRVMLSLAYGADQSRSMQIHKPEVCYQNQGFKLSGAAKATAKLAGEAVPVMHLVASMGARNEPITYWIRTGEYVVRGWVEQTIARVKNSYYKGVTPDGLLVRVSSFDTDEPRAYALQENFLSSMVAGAPRAGQDMLLGGLASHLNTPAAP